MSDGNGGAMRKRDTGKILQSMPLEDRVRQLEQRVGKMEQFQAQAFSQQQERLDHLDAKITQENEDTRKLVNARFDALLLHLGSIAGVER